MLVPGASLLKDKVAIVTGGGGGIGKAISLAYAAHGAKVVVAEQDAGRANDTVAEIDSFGGSSLPCVVDVRERDQVAFMAETALSKYGQIDILVNNVGHFLSKRQDFLDTNEEYWDALYRVNLHHVFLCCKAIVPRMIERGAGGIVINVSTVEAFRAIPQHALYAAFKGAISQFTKTFALEVARYGIRVNDIAPDTTETIQVQPSRTIPPEQRHMVPIWYPIGYYGQPDHIAGVAVFLASDLSKFVLGTTIHADGGTLAAGGWYRQDTGRWTNGPRQP